MKGKDIKHMVISIASQIQQYVGKRKIQIGILANNSPQWAMVDYGIILSGNVTVALYQKLSSDKILDRIRDSEIELLFIQSENMLQKLSFDLKNRFPQEIA